MAMRQFNRDWDRVARRRAAEGRRPPRPRLPRKRRRPCNLAVRRPAPGTLSADTGEIQPADPAKFNKEPGYSPYAGRRYPERPYFGDEHVHTAWSVDAGGSGATLGPEEATRFARGEEVTSTSGQPVKLGQPLDWVAITDHSDMMGMITEIKGGNPEMMADPTLKRWRDMFNGGPVEAKKAVMELVAAQSNKKLPPAATDPRFAKSVWAKNTTIAEKYNEPGRFTAFIGYEWTSNAGGGDNLHRNIIYRDNKDKADRRVAVHHVPEREPRRPLEVDDRMGEDHRRQAPRDPAQRQSLERPDVRADDLQRRPDDQGVGRRAAALGAAVRSDSDEGPERVASVAVADRRLRRLRALGPRQPDPDAEEAGHDCGTNTSREALKNGLKVEQDLGTNPFKFGMAGGTDTHNGLVAAEEDNFFAKFPSAEPRADRWEEDAMNFGPNRIVKGWEMTAAGYTAVWATGNTRAELWDAMMRRETYATSGPRMTVRFFGGYDFTAADATRTPAVAGYAKGVPMGGDLPAAPAGKAPTFLVAALKDRFSGNLDRIQIIKGWLGKDGKPQEKIYDVVWGDKDRRKIVNGKLTPVGNTVDVATATWTNTIGDPELVTVWTDPDFDPSVRAVYYARVLEIPTPRWTAYDAAYFKIKITDPKVPMTTQERAFTSPIWYSPK